MTAARECPKCGYDGVTITTHNPHAHADDPAPVAEFLSSDDDDTIAVYRITNEHGTFVVHVEHQPDSGPIDVIDCYPETTNDESEIDMTTWYDDDAVQQHAFVPGGGKPFNVCRVCGWASQYHVVVHAFDPSFGWRGVFVLVHDALGIEAT